jgi:hypothetical protein
VELLNSVPFEPLARLARSLLEFAALPPTLARTSHAAIPPSVVVFTPHGARNSQLWPDNKINVKSAIHVLRLWCAHILLKHALNPLIIANKMSAILVMDNVSPAKFAHFSQIMVMISANLVLIPLALLELAPILLHLVLKSQHSIVK